MFSRYVTVYGFTPIYAVGLGASRAELGVLTTVSMLTYTAASFLAGGVLARTLGHRIVVTAGLAIAALGTLIIPLITDFSLLVLSQAVGGVSRGALFPVLMALSLQDAGAGAEATAMGAFQAFYAGGMTRGPAFARLLADAFGLGGAFVATGLLTGAGAVLAWRGIGRAGEPEAAVWPEGVGLRP